MTGRLSLPAERVLVQQRIVKKQRQRVSTAGDLALLKMLTTKQLAREIRERRRRKKESA